MLHTLTTFYLSLSHNRYQSRPGVHGCLVSVPYRPRGAWVLLMSVPTGRSTQPPASPERLCRTLEDWSGCRISSWVLAVCVLIPKKSMPFAVMKTQNTFLCLLDRGGAGSNSGVCCPGAKWHNRVFSLGVFHCGAFQMFKHYDSCSGTKAGLRPTHIDPWNLHTGSLLLFSIDASGINLLKQTSWNNCNSLIR